MTIFENQVEVDKQPELEARPIFRLGVTIIVTFIFTTFLTPFIGGISSGVLFMLLVLLVTALSEETLKGSLQAIQDSGKVTEENMYTWIAVVPSVFFAVVYGVLFLLIFRWLKGTSDRTVYRFFPNHMEYAEGFRTKTYSTLRYSDILNLTLTQTPSQERQGIGTVTLETASYRGRMVINNIANYQEVVRYIQTKISEGVDKL